MQLLTTVQIRKIMRANGLRPAYTNKTTGHDGNIRRVKCYYSGHDATLLAALYTACGPRNVTLTKGNDHYLRGGGPGITVKCVLA